MATGKTDTKSNPSSNAAVVKQDIAAIETKTLELIQLCNTMAQPGSRTARMAETCFNEAARLAVKAATELE